ncbi:hypothetical protein GOBAR_DD22124 [Gossypium barbadense]|nr:hypothetical protein GOBAR_DD22124 [Gossypium barbadense]
MGTMILCCGGYSLLRDPRHNKGLAFTETERDSHYLRGLLPPAVVTQQLQEKKLMNSIRNYQVPLQKYMAMMELQGKVLDVLKNWPERSIQVMGIPARKLSLYTKLGGVRPSALSIFDMAIFMCLPVTIDVGTNNEEYANLLHEFMTAVKNYGEKVLIQVFMPRVHYFIRFNI